MIFVDLGWQVGPKIDQKSMKNRSQLRKASWHRFLMDFGGFLEASWEGKSSQDRTRQDKTGLDRTRQDKTETRQDKTRLWQKKVPWGDFAAGGWAGFARLLGGYLPVDLEPSRLGSSAVRFSTSKRFFVVPVLGPFLDPFLFALPGLLGRSKIPLGRPPGNFVGILAPE